VVRSIDSKRPVLHLILLREADTFGCPVAVADDGPPGDVAFCQMLAQALEMGLGGTLQTAVEVLFFLHQ
jgi:hypothetical protein